MDGCRRRRGPERLSGGGFPRPILETIACLIRNVTRVPKCRAAGG